MDEVSESSEVAKRIQEYGDDLPDAVSRLLTTHNDRQHKSDAGVQPENPNSLADLVELWDLADWLAQDGYKDPDRDPFEP